MRIKPESPSEHLLYTTVKVIAFQNGLELGTGTAFFFVFQLSGGLESLTLVTNEHVVRGADLIQFFVHVTDPEGKELEHYPVAFTLRGRCFNHPNTEIDLCIIMITELPVKLRRDGYGFLFVPFREKDVETDAGLAKLSAVNDVIMVGYPNDVYDEINNYPCFRRGITSLHPSIDYQGQPKGLLDISCWEGSSGSPVMVLNENLFTDKASGPYYTGSRQVFLGVVYAKLLFSESGEIEELDIPVSRKDKKPLRAMGVIGAIEKTIESIRNLGNLLVKGRFSVPVTVHMALYIKGHQLLGFKPVLEGLPVKILKTNDVD